MSVINKDGRKVAAKNIKDDVNNVLRSASNYKGKSNKPKKQEIPDTKELLVNFYDKLIHESENIKEKEQLQQKFENTDEMTSAANKPKTKDSKSTYRKNVKKGSELVIPCTNDLCAKVRQLVEMNAQVQRFRKKFLEPPAIEQDRKALHQKKIEVGNLFSKKNLSAFKKSIPKCTKSTKSPVQMQGSRKVGWNPQTLITPDVLGSSSTESLLALSAELESCYEPCVEYSEVEKMSARSFQNLYGCCTKNMRKHSQEIGCESDYATCIEDNPGNSIPARKTSSAKMLIHFRNLLDQHNLHKDKEKMKGSVLTDDEVQFLQNVIEADEKYRYLQSEDHKLLKEVLRFQLKQIETQERILEDALRKLRIKTGSFESVRQDQCAFSTEYKFETIPEKESSKKTLEKLDSLGLETLVFNMNSVEQSMKNNSFNEGFMTSYRSQASTRQESSQREYHDVCVALDNFNDCKLSKNFEIEEVLTNPIIVMENKPEMIAVNYDSPGRVPSFNSILETLETKTPRTPPVSPAGFSARVGSQRQNQFYHVQEKETISNSASPREIFDMEPKIPLSPLSPGKQHVVPVLNLDSVSLEAPYESPKENRQVLSSPDRNENSENNNPEIKVIFKNISSPQKEIQLLKAISARLEKTFEKTGKTYSLMKSIEVNLNDDSEKAAAALSATKSFSEINMSHLKTELDKNLVPKVISNVIYETMIKFENEEPQKADIFEYETLAKVEFLTTSFENYVLFEEYPTSFVQAIYLSCLLHLVKEFKVKYLSLQEMKCAGDFYIFRPKSEIFQPEKTNFEQLQKNPAEFAKMLTPRFQRDNEVSNQSVPLVSTSPPAENASKDTENKMSQVNLLRVPDEAVIQSVLCCLFKTWATYQATNPNIWNNKFEEICESKQKIGAGDYNLARRKSKKQEIPEQSISKLSLEDSVPINGRTQDSKVSLKFIECKSSEDEKISKKTCVCQTNSCLTKENLLEKKKKVKNCVVFLAQFVLFVLLVLSLSMPDYQCLKF